MPLGTYTEAFLTFSLDIDYRWSRSRAATLTDPVEEGNLEIERITYFPRVGLAVDLTPLLTEKIIDPDDFYERFEESIWEEIKEGREE